MDKVTIINSTVGKALGGAAGEGISVSEALHVLRVLVYALLFLLMA